MNHRILVFYGSYRSDRMGIRLAQFVVEGLRTRGDDVALIDAKAVGLPMHWGVQPGLKNLTDAGGRSVLMATRMALVSYGGRASGRSRTWRRACNWYIEVVSKAR
jgi:NAD(P)H-dependent FMN reductase